MAVHLRDYALHDHFKKQLIKHAGMSTKDADDKAVDMVVDVSGGKTKTEIKQRLGKI